MGSEILYSHLSGYTEAALGAVLALPYLLAARRSRRPTIPLALGLVAAAALYVGFAVAARAGLVVAALEVAGLIGFGSMAWLGIRRTPRWLAVGWLMHVGWDVGLHPMTPDAYAPHWYPSLCVGFDLVVAVAIWVHYRRRSVSSEPARESR